jgi:hypothetical protein
MGKITFEVGSAVAAAAVTHAVTTGDVPASVRWSMVGSAAVLGAGVAWLVSPPTAREDDEPALVGAPPTTAPQADGPQDLRT